MIFTVEKKIFIATMVNDDHCWSQDMARQDVMVSKVSVLLTFCQGVCDDGGKDK